MAPPALNNKQNVGSDFAVFSVCLARWHLAVAGKRELDGLRTNSWASENDEIPAEIFFLRLD